MPRNFCEMLDELNQGTFIDDCGHRLTEVLKAVEDTGADGSLTIELKLKWNGDGTLLVAPTCKMKKPAKKRPPTVMFRGKDGLFIENPNQPSLFDKSKVREISPSNRPITNEI